MTCLVIIDTCCWVTFFNGGTSRVRNQDQASDQATSRKLGKKLEWKKAFQCLAGTPYNIQIYVVPQNLTLNQVL